MDAFERLEDYDIEPAEIEAHWYGVPQHRPRVLIIGIRKDVGRHDASAGLGGGLLPSPDGSPPDPIDFLATSWTRTTGPEEPVEYPVGAANEVQEEYRRDRHGHVRERGEPLSEHAYSNHHGESFRKFEYMPGTRRGGPGVRPDSQVLAARPPRPLALARPDHNGYVHARDDYVHFSQPRTLTVREWARLQTFPDWYEFSGKRTTGGRRRAGDPSRGRWEREVPKYTQIGNAVPVRLARALGRHLRVITG